MSAKQKKQPKTNATGPIPRLKRKAGLYLKDTQTVKGRGVFCSTDIRAGEILEVTPALILDETQTKLADKTLLKNYTFVTGNVSVSMRRQANVGKTGNASSVVMGILTFCNHGQEPNAEVLWEEHGDTLYYFLRATRRIPKNTEIRTSYGRDWFAVRNMGKAPEKKKSR